MNKKITQFNLLQYNIVVVLLMVSLNFSAYSQLPVGSTGKTQALLNEPVDISGDFRNFSNTYYLADSLSSFDPNTGSERLSYKRYEYFTRQAFDNMLAVLKQEKFRLLFWFVKEQLFLILLSHNQLPRWIGPNLIW